MTGNEPYGGDAGLPTGGETGAWAERLLRFAPLVVALAAIAVYANSLGNGFAYDDDWIIRLNRRVHDASDLRAIWLTPYWPTSGTVLGLYRPLTIQGFAVQWSLAGGGPWLFHLVTVLLHAAVCVACYFLLLELASRTAALVGAIVFAVHPVHTEAVANVVGQAEVVAALCVVLACLIWVRRPPGVVPRWTHVIAVGLLYALGMLAKEHAIVLPGLMVALDAARGALFRRGQSLGSASAEHPAARFVAYSRSVLRPMAWLFVVALAYLLLRLHVLGSIAGSDPGPSLPYLRENVRLLTALRAWPEFARLLIWPADLSADYSPAVVLPAASVSPMIVLGFLLLIGSMTLAALTPRVPRAGLPAAWFLISILPVSNLLFPIGVLLAERTLYLPSIAIAIAAAFLWQAFAAAAAEEDVRTRTVRHRALLGIALLAAVGLMAERTVRRNPDWADIDAVMTALLRDHPESYRAQWAAAVRAAEAEDFVAAEEHWALSHAMWSRDPQMLAEMAVYYLMRGHPARAAEMLATVRRLAPMHPRPVMMLPVALHRAGRPHEALEAAIYGMRVIGPDPRLLELRARIHSDVGQHDLAAASWRLVIRRFRDGNAEQWRLLGQELASAGRSHAAAAALDTAAARARAAADPLRRDSFAPLPPALTPQAAADSVAATRSRFGL